MVYLKSQLELSAKELEAITDSLSYDLASHSPKDDPAYSLKKDLYESLYNHIYCDRPWMLRGGYKVD